MEVLVVSRQPLPSPFGRRCGSSPSPPRVRWIPRSRVSCSAPRSPPVVDDSPKPVYYKPGVMDDLFLAFFRGKMVEEVGWDSKKPGYDGLIEVANRLMVKGRTNSETAESAVRVLRSLFPPFLLELFQMLIAPIGRGKVAAVMVARATALSCQWLMGPCSVNSIDLPGGSNCKSGVFVERCRYLEESKCVGICINTCKQPTQAVARVLYGVTYEVHGTEAEAPNKTDTLWGASSKPTQTFFKDCMGIPLMMEPNFKDYSCQFKFGVLPPHASQDELLMEPCLEICPNANRRRVSGSTGVEQCPKA